MLLNGVDREWLVSGAVGGAAGTGGGAPPAMLSDRAGDDASRGRCPKNTGGADEGTGGGVGFREEEGRVVGSSLLAEGVSGNEGAVADATVPLVTTVWALATDADGDFNAEGDTGACPASAAMAMAVATTA